MDAFENEITKAIKNDAEVKLEKVDEKVVKLRQFDFF
mgnify:CR=1 FL=1